jgi:hypothetical protein
MRNRCMTSTVCRNRCSWMVIFVSIRMGGGTHDEDQINDEHGLQNMCSRIGITIGRVHRARYTALNSDKEGEPTR